METVGVQTSAADSPPRMPSPDLQDEIDVLMKKLNIELEPLVSKKRDLRKELELEKKKLACLLREQYKTTDENQENALQEQIRDSNGMVEETTDLINIYERSIADVKKKHAPAIRKLESQVQDKVKEGIPPEYIDQINKRLEAIAKKLGSRFSSLCGKLSLLSDLGYQNSRNDFTPRVSNLPEGAFEHFCDVLDYIRKRLPACFSDREAKRRVLSMPFFLCGLDGMDADFNLDLEVSIGDDVNELSGEADIVIYCGNVEIIVIEEKRGDNVESAIPQALAEMDCLSKKRLSAKPPGLQLGKVSSYGIVTDCFRWFFLKLDVDGTYSQSCCYELPGNLVGVRSQADLGLLRAICVRIRGLVKEAME